MKKNCNNCRHLEWGYGDVGDPEGFVCNKRDYYKNGDSYTNERNHQYQLSKDSYLERAKSCCDLNLVENGKRFCFDYFGAKVFEGDTVEYYHLTKCRDLKGVGVIACIADMNEKQINMPYIKGEGAWSQDAIKKITAL